MSSLLYLYRCLSLSGTLWVFTFSLYFECGLVSILVCYKWTTRRTQIDQKSTIYLKRKQLCQRQFKSVQKVWKKWFSLLSPHLFLFLSRLCCLSTCYVILKPTECVVHGFYFTFFYLFFSDKLCTTLKKKRSYVSSLSEYMDVFYPEYSSLYCMCQTLIGFFHSCLQSCQLPCLCLWATLLFWPFCNGQPM